jgi:hypothetical protein
MEYETPASRLYGHNIAVYELALKLAILQSQSEWEIPLT